MRNLFFATAIAASLAGTSLAETKTSTQPATQGAAAKAEKSAYAVLSASDQFGSFLKAVDSAGLKDLLENSSAPLTIFAPTDSAFKKLPKEKLDRVLLVPFKR